MYNNIYTISERKNLISETLKLLRKTKHLTQKEVAEKLGINTEAYATYERGRNEPPAEILVRLSFLYDLPVDVIIQKDNFGKDDNAVIEQLKNFDSIADEFKSKILSGDPETRDAITYFADMLSKFSDTIKPFTKENSKK